MAGIVVTVAGSILAVGWRIADPAPIVPNTFGYADLETDSREVVHAAASAVRPTRATVWLRIVTRVDPATTP